MNIRLEHANMIVRDIDGVAGFLKTAFPDFRVRKEGDNRGKRWMHIGTDDTYMGPVSVERRSSGSTNAQESVLEK